MTQLILRLQTLDEDAAPRAVDIRQLIVAGWTGRDKAAVEKHIKELEDLGVQRPATVPVFYRAAANRLTTAEEIEATGEESSGEVEFVLLRLEGKLWVGVGSDHTDRKVETYNVSVSKQMCEKPIAPDFWAFDDVADHWDDLVSRSYVLENGERVLYQEGPVAAMIDPRELIERSETDSVGLPEATLMFCGTHAAKGGIRPAGRFEFELEDPVLKRTIGHGYAIKTLPVLG